jgi:hypothetical protein
VNIFIKIINYCFRLIFWILKKISKRIDDFYNLTFDLRNHILPHEKFKLISNRDIEKFLLKNEDDKIETLFFPKIFDLSLGGEIKVLTKGIRVYEFRNVSFALNSDFIRFYDKSVFCDKIERIESIFNKCGDQDFISLQKNAIILKRYSKRKNFNYVFHLTGCFSKVWTHFLVQFLPKLKYLNVISRDEKIAILLPENIDSHIVKMVDFFVKDLDNVEINFVTDDTLVFCKKIIYVSNDTWLSDIGISPSIFHIKISDSTVNFLLTMAKKMCENISKYQNQKKIFIGRVGKRNIENYSEVLKYFESNGFVEIFPHLLTFNEKLEIFSNADFIAGPLSSGFANIIFCLKSPVVLVLSNQSRYSDMFFTKFAKSLNINYNTFIAKETLVGNEDSDYIIDLVALKKCMSTLNYNHSPV